MPASVTTHEYDEMDRLSTRSDPLTRTETFTYDPVGNLVSTTDRKGQTTTFAYDALNRRVTSTFADGAVATFTYDAAGRLTVADDTADPHRPVGLAYDALDRLITETTALGTVSYAYDFIGRRTQMTVAGQAPVAYGYDRNSRLRTIVQEPLAPVTLQYDAAGRRTLLTLPNGVSTEYQYDPTSRFTAIIYRNTLGILGDLTYTYDPAGNRTSVGGSFARTLLPDPVPSATYDAANQQLAFGDKVMAFDANGNLATLTDPTGTTTFTWDGRNRLTALIAPGVTATFAYDASGRRAARTVNGSTRQFLYDSVEIARETVDGAISIYLNGPGADERLMRISEAGSSSYLADVLGSILTLIDPTGSATAEYAYEPFGRSFASGATLGNPFTYTAREDDGTGLYFFRTRYYDPQVSRFVSEDPIRLIAGDPNFYVYARNNPVAFADPLGLIVGGYGIEGNAGVGIVGAELAFDLVADTSGNMGIAVTFALTFGPQFSAGAGHGPLLSTANTVSDLNGEFQGVGFNSPIVGADLTRAIDPKTGRGTTVYTADVRGGLPNIGGGVFAQAGGTAVVPIWLPSGLKNQLNAALLQAATGNAKLRNAVLGPETGVQPAVLGRRK